MKRGDGVTSMPVLKFLLTKFRHFLQAAKVPIHKGTKTWLVPKMEEPSANDQEAKSPTNVDCGRDIDPPALATSSNLANVTTRPTHTKHKAGEEKCALSPSGGVLRREMSSVATLHPVTVTHEQEDVQSTDREPPSKKPKTI